MPKDNQHLPENNSDRDDTYFFRRISSATNIIAMRSASDFAAFFLPSLRPGMQLLDCGCGPGSITLDLAQIVAPGQVVGIDINTEQIEQARTLAAEKRVSNLSFETASIFDLPFPDSSFDAVFSHGVLEHLEGPMEAVVEMGRVLSPGGVIGVSCADSDGGIIAPPEPLLLETFALINKGIENRGGNPRIGKSLRSLLNKAGFTNVEASAFYEYYGSQEANRQIGTLMASFALEADLADRETKKRLSKAWKVWSENLDGFLGLSRCGAIGWRKKG